jgi:hypothetical protein
MSYIAGTPQEVGRLTGIMFSLTLAVAFVEPFIGGVLWDLFHLPAMALVPVAAGVILMLLGELLPSHSSFGIPGKTKHMATPPGVLSQNVIDAC